jgi:anti-sigma factor RsiW
MTAAVDGELTPGRRRALDRHLGACQACGREMATTARALALLGALPMEVAVPGALEQATLRRMRLEAAEAEEAAGRQRWWSPRLPALALASGGVVALAIGLLRSSPDTPAVGGRAPVVASGPVSERREARVARAQAKAPPARASRMASVPIEPPPDLAAAPDLFVDLPLLKDLEKVANFEAIGMVTLDDAPAAGVESPSSG